jgi:anti-sigma factor RsiW
MTIPYDPLQFLTTPEAVEAYLEAYAEDGEEMQRARFTAARALRNIYDPVLEEEIPDRFKRLLNDLS